MTRDDLHKPLNAKPDRRFGRTGKLGLLGWATTCFAAAGTGLVIWLGIAHNPLGGEPMATLKLNLPHYAGRLPQGELKIRKSLRPQARPAAQLPKPHNPLDNAHDPVKSAVKANAIARSLAPAPTLKSLLEKGPNGPLPRIGRNGHRPSRAYAKPLGRDRSTGKRPRIAIFIGDLGLSAAGTRQAINNLPGEVTLAFAPYGEGLGRWRARARARGHEALLQLPMEPFDYPDNDPGPYTLLTKLKPADNKARLKWLMARFTGYFGVTNYMGAKLSGDAAAMTPILAELKARGLVYVESGMSSRSTSPALSRRLNIGFARSDVIIDAVHSRKEIDAALKRLETLALEKGIAIGSGSGLPVTISRLKQWIATLPRKGIQLIPVSAAVSGTGTNQAMRQRR
jgi:polysaccharide deacetylase 2 family uncharacterized protein YibQ